MPMRITWPTNEGGERKPNRVLDTVAVKVSLFDPGGQSVQPRRIEARISDREEPLEATASEGAQATFAVWAPQRWYWRGPRLKFTSSSVTGEGVNEVESRLLLTGPMSRVALGAQVLGASALLYLLLVFPQFVTAATWITNNIPVALLGGLTLSAAFGWLRSWLLLRPLASLVVAGALVAGALLIHQSVYLVVNSSLDPLELAPAAIAAGDSRLAFKAVPGADQVVCKKNLTETCVRLIEPTSYWHRFVRLLAHDSIEVGCRQDHFLDSRPELWKTLGKCRPPHPPVLEGVRIGDVFAGEKSPSTDDETRADIALEDWRVRLGDRSWYRTISFPESLPAGYTDGLVLRMTGRGALRTITAPIRTGTWLTPVKVGAGSRILAAEVLASSTVIGSLVTSLSESVDTGCALAVSDQRLGGLALRHEQLAYVFKAEIPELLSAFPVCWAETERPPEVGELQLDARWAPLADWTLRLPERFVPHHLAIIDGAKRYVGAVTCDRPRVTASNVRWEIGPLWIEGSSSQFQKLKAEAWTAADGIGATGWIWACWPEGSPPSVLKGNGRWLATSREGTGRVYSATERKVVCTMSSDLVEMSPGQSCQPFEKPEPSPWFAKWGPVHCDENLSKLCARSEGKRP